jgi:hypothetical protein
MPVQIAVQMTANQLPFLVRIPKLHQKARLQERCLGGLKSRALPHHLRKSRALQPHLLK